MRCLPWMISALLLVPASGALAQNPPERGAPGQPTELPISIDLRDAPLRSALEQVFDMAHKQYAIAPEVSGTITVKVRDMPFSQALNLILRGSGDRLTWRLQQGVYYVEHAKGQPRLPAATRPSGLSTGAQGITVPIRNLPAADLLQQLAAIRPEAIDEILVQTGTNTLLVFSNDPAAVDLLRQRVQLLDVASDPVTLKAEIVRVDEKNVRTVLFSTTIQGRSGKVSTVTDKAAGGAAGESDIRILLTPTSLAGGVEVASTWNLSLSLKGTKGEGVRLEKTVTTITQIQPGKPTVVGETKQNQSGLKDQILLMLSVQPESPTRAENPGSTRVNL